MSPAIVILTLLFTAAAQAAVFDVKSFGAKGDGTTLDSPAINRAVEAAAAAGGGTVNLPPGRYLSGSIRLKSHIRLHLEGGAVLVASGDASAYDKAEPNRWTQFQDFGHSHWHNSLIWGENLEDLAITGTGLIDGKGLTRGERPGAGNKAIALKLCRNVLLRDFAILNGGHFGVLATGTDNLTIDNVRMDTNRDGIDVDGCRNVRISNVSINSPNDDAIVLKSSFALGSARPTEQVTIADSLVSGYDIGSLLDATYKRTVTAAPDRDGPTGRIKIGTESTGAFRNIVVSNVVFDRSRGLAIESVDGSVIEDVSVSNLTMRDVSNAPIFIRLGARMRAPEGTPVGSIRRVNISNVVASDADPRYASIITGIPGHPVEDVRLSNIHIQHRGGLSLDEAAKQPAGLVNGFFFRGAEGQRAREAFTVPERERDYPEPAMFGVLPAYGFYLRHATGIEFDHVDTRFVKEDRRPAVVMEDVNRIVFHRVNAQTAAGVCTFALKGPLSGVEVQDDQHRPMKAPADCVSAEGSPAR